MKREYNDIFKNDRLNIQSNVIDFAHLIEQDTYHTNNTSKVYSLNARFGIGKTFFCDHLMEVLKKDGIRVAKLNIWEMDFYDNPLMPILSELNELYKKDGEELPNKILNFGKVLSKKAFLSMVECVANAASAYIAGRISKETGCDINPDNIKLLDSIKNQCSDDDLYNEYQEYREAILNLKKCLRKWAQKGDSPIVMIIDELDRCKPDYAVQTLETLKHFFDIPGFVFILAIDEKQLENSVKSLFGTTDFDGYKRKFINNTFLLPSPNRNAFTEFLYDKSKIADVIKQIQDNRKELLFKVNIYNVFHCTFDYSQSGNIDEEQKAKEFNKEQNSELVIKRYFAEYANLFKFSLRQMEQVFDRFVLFVKQIVNSNELFSPDLAVFLVCLHEFDINVYNEVKKETSGLTESVIDRIINTYAKTIYGAKEVRDRLGNFNRKRLPQIPKTPLYSLTNDTKRQIIFDNVDRFFCADMGDYFSNDCTETTNSFVSETGKMILGNELTKRVLQFRKNYFKHMDFILHFE